jgi:hypothetical protein
MNREEKINRVKERMPDLFDDYYNFEDMMGEKDIGRLRRDLVHIAGCVYGECCYVVDKERMVVEGWVEGVRIPRSLRWILGRLK